LDCHLASADKANAVAFGAIGITACSASLYCSSAAAAAAAEREVVVEGEGEVGADRDRLQPAGAAPDMMNVAAAVKAETAGECGEAAAAGAPHGRS
jgi:hypothetical protein